MKHAELKTSSLSSFKFLRPHILCGQELSDIKLLTKSIRALGVICPIVIMRINDSFVVVDGKRRLVALRRLAFEDPDFVEDYKIPYISILEYRSGKFHIPELLSNEKLYDTVTHLIQRGYPKEIIAERLSLCRRTIINVAGLSRLSESVRHAYFRHDLSHTQAFAYGTCPSKKVQTLVFLKLGNGQSAELVTTILKTAMQNSQVADKPVKGTIENTRPQARNIKLVEAA